MFGATLLRKTPTTPATCRAFYIHPAVLMAFEAGRLEHLAEEVETDEVPESAEGLSPEERLAMALLPRLEAEFGDGIPEG